MPIVYLNCELIDRKRNILEVADFSEGLESLLNKH